MFGCVMQSPALGKGPHPDSPPETLADPNQKSMTTEEEAHTTPPKQTHATTKGAFSQCS